MAPVFPHDAGSLSDPSDGSYPDTTPPSPISTRRVRQTPSFTLDLDIHQEDIVTPSPDLPVPSSSTTNTMMSTTNSNAPHPQPPMLSSSRPDITTTTIPKHTSFYVTQSSSFSSPTRPTTPPFTAPSSSSSWPTAASSDRELYQPTPIAASSSASYSPTSAAPSRYVRPAQSSPPPFASSNYPSSPASSTSSTTSTNKPNNPYSSHYSHSQQRDSSESLPSLSSRRSSNSTDGGARPNFSLDLSSPAISGSQIAEMPNAASGSGPSHASGSGYQSGSTSGEGAGYVSAFADTPMPGLKEVEDAKASASYNYFSSNRVGVDSGDSSAEGGEGSPVNDMFFEEDEGLGYLEKIYLFARSKAVFHR